MQRLDILEEIVYNIVYVRMLTHIIILEVREEAFYDKGRNVFFGT